MSAKEIRVTSETGASKGMKLARHDLIPAPVLKMLAEHYGKGALKYPPVNGRDNWRGGYPISLSYGAMQRHANNFWMGNDYDAHDQACPEGCVDHTESHELIAVIWHAITQITILANPELAALYDDRQDKP